MEVTVNPSRFCSFRYRAAPLATGLLLAVTALPAWAQVTSEQESSRRALGEAVAAAALTETRYGARSQVRAHAKPTMV